MKIKDWKKNPRQKNLYRKNNKKEKKINMKDNKIKIWNVYIGKRKIKR